MLNLFLKASLETFYMLVATTAASTGCGLGLGLLLFLVRPKGPLARPGFFHTLSLTINLLRSVPFIILLVALIPLTRLLLGTSIGSSAAILPLTVAAAPFYARLVYNALSELPEELNETAETLGATTMQKIFYFYLPEALPGLISAAAVTAVGILGYSAMAGTVGGGGLGDLAIRYGYQRFQTGVIFATVAILVTLAQLIQFSGDWFERRLRKQ